MSKLERQSVIHRHSTLITLVETQPDTVLWKKTLTELNNYFPQTILQSLLFDVTWNQNQFADYDFKLNVC